MSDNTGRFQTFFVSFVIGVLLPAVFPSGNLAVTTALVVTVLAMFLWVRKVWDRKEGEPLLPIGGVIAGILVALALPAPLLPLPFAAVAIAFAVLHA